MKDEKEGEMKKSELKFWRYLQFYGKDVFIIFNPDNERQGTIILYGLAYENQNVIYHYLESWFPQYTFTPDFIAGNGRIEFYIR